MANQNFNTFGRGGVIADQASFDVGLRAHMIRVYNYMASGLALSGIVAFALFSSPELAGLFFQVHGERPGRRTERPGLGRDPRTARPAAAGLASAPRR